ncbi:hypothetical protein ACFYZB_23600 [Streptomyces sp. NPDC001852]|uniref:hypothetical protein n=1 Tax=Streptomyces sp. NPDC001852 TaxID=3364619 RepID=UPI00369D28D2
MTKLLIGLTVFTVMTTWQRGRGLVTAERAQLEGRLPEFIDDLRSGKVSTLRIPGTACSSTAASRQRRRAPNPRGDSF